MCIRDRTDTTVIHSIVPVILEGEAAGVALGGVLDQTIHELVPVDVPSPGGDRDGASLRAERRTAARVLGHQAALALASSRNFTRFMVVEENCRFRLPVTGTMARMLEQLLNGCRERDVYKRQTPACRSTGTAWFPPPVRRTKPPFPP